LPYGDLVQMAYLGCQNGNGLYCGIVTQFTTLTISVTFGPLARKHISLTLHYQWFDPFQILAYDYILILANHDQSELDCLR